MLTFDIGTSLFRCATILDSYEKKVCMGAGDLSLAKGEEWW